ncbi:hypothetical protein J6590_032305 [Homalodisca vitripennis]|nr:hypothetical protein J6590_032305 [Homalodisca vitripennis]
MSDTNHQLIKNHMYLNDFDFYPLKTILNTHFLPMWVAYLRCDVFSEEDLIEKNKRERGGSV